MAFVIRYGEPKPEQLNRAFRFHKVTGTRMAHGSNWYVLQSGRWVGPMSAAQVQALARSGQLAPSDLVAQEGMPSGMTAADAGFVAGAGVVAPAADLASR